MRRPQAFPETLLPHETVELRQTHASAALLAGTRVYKMKKAHNFGFFDYSTPLLRRQFCEQEVVLNARLATGIYQGVAPVLASADGTFCFGPTFSPEHIPAPGTPLEQGHVIDYAVVMQRLPDEATLAARVVAGTATPELLARVAEPIAHFHMTTPTSKYISGFGDVHVIRGNWDENFAQIRPYIGRSLDQATFEQISTSVYAFCTHYTPLFTTRMQEQRIRDCHGDLRLQHVYILDQPQSTTPVIQIIDCIEFNERFRYSDVAAEVAFLAMELDAAHRADLSRAFIDAYVRLTSDDALFELLPFYACYRACVRGKVLSFQLDQPEVPAEQRELARQEATALFTLAASYASGPTRPTLLLIGGLMGSGKSTLAQLLHTQLGWALLSSDTTRKQLAQQEPAPTTQPLDAYGTGLYTPAWNTRTYQALLNQAATSLASGRSVILDATFSQRAYRHAAAQEAALHDVNLVFIECQCPRELALQRLTRRWQARLVLQPELTSAASDARPDLYDAQAEAWQPFYADEEPATEHLITSTVTVPNLTQIFNTLSIPHTLRYPFTSP